MSGDEIRTRTLPLLREIRATICSSLNGCWSTVGEGNALWALQSRYKLQKGVINTQSVFRFNDLDSANGVTFAIVGGTGKFKKAHGTVTPRRVGQTGWMSGEELPADLTRLR